MWMKKKWVSSFESPSTAAFMFVIMWIQLLRHRTKHNIFWLSEALLWRPEMSLHSNNLHVSLTIVFHVSKAFFFHKPHGQVLKG